MIQLPILRAGRPYRSLDTAELTDIRTGESVARVSQANRGLIARDFTQAAENRKALTELSVKKLLAICKRAAELFANAELPVDAVDGVTQTPDEFVASQSSTTGMPEALCRANMDKIRFVLAEMEQVLGGLTRGIDLSILDDGWTRQDGRTVSYLGQADTLGAVLPSNSPGVHSLWVPSVPLKVPLVLKPGSREPWTPVRIAQALIAAGCPGEAIGFYPTDYSGATEVLLRSDRSMLFGDESTVRAWKQDSRVQLHGPGWSKILFGKDRAGHWEKHLDLLVASVAENGGRSCVNASGIWLPANGRALANAMAERLVKIEARPLTDPQAQLCAFSDPRVARRISEFIDRNLRIPGATDVTAELRQGDRLVEVDGCTFVLPTVIWCDDPEHPLASTELLLPFVSLVQVPQEEIARRIGPTLVASVITADERFKHELMAARHVDRLNLGPFHTSRVSWDQPHEGNLFEHLYRQRSFQSEQIAS